MPVLYGGISIRPAPYVTLSRSTEKLGDGRVVGTTTTANLTGTIVATKTADTESTLAIEQRLSAIVQKQRALRDIFQTSGLWFEIQGYDGTQAVKFIATVESVEFQEGPWVEKCDYSVTLTGEVYADEDYAEENHIESASESWQYEEAEGPNTFRATHTLQAKGKTFYESASGTVTKKAWEWARDFVENKMKLDWATVNASWSPKGGKEIFEGGLMEPGDDHIAYNRIISENVDESEGSYSVTETFFLSTEPFWEEYTISVRKELVDPKAGNIVSISGTIHGLSAGLDDNIVKLANAEARWVTVKTLIFTRASLYATGVTLNSKATLQSHDYNVNDGSISYQYEFNDRTLVNHTTEYYNVSSQTSVEDSKTTVTIDGTISGELYVDDTFNPLTRYNRALAQWELVKLLLYARAKADSGIIDLQPFPLSASLNPNKQDGIFTYSYSFDNREPSEVRHDFTVSTRYGREDGRTIVSIDGSVTGLRTANPTTPFMVNTPEERYDNAVTYFNSISPSLIGLLSNYVEIDQVNPLPFSRSVSHIPNGGQLSYQYEYNSNPSPCVANALSENITITDDRATPVIAVIPVLGRAKGPVMQDIGTVKEKRRSVSIEIVMPTDFTTTNTCVLNDPPDFDIGPYAPNGDPVYLEQDQTQWSPNNGHFSRTVSWIYE